MKEILIFFYDQEIKTNSTNSVARLVGAVIKELESKYNITFFTFNPCYSDKNIFSKPKLAKIYFLQRIRQKVVNFFFKTKRIKEFHLKKEAIRRSAIATNTKYDFVIVLALDEVDFLRTNFPDAVIIYWIHNISAICKKEYLCNVNKADYFLSPSRTTYHLLLEKLQPAPLTAPFYFTPNWCDEVFKQTDTSLIRELKEMHDIASGSIVFIFSGSDLKLKGKFILEKVIKSLSAEIDQEIVFFFAGSDNNIGEQNWKNIRLIHLGLLEPPKLAAYFHISSFGCFPSLAYDHCPLTLLELIHCNVLPLASDIGGVKEITGSNYKFLVKEPHSIDAWTEAIKQALSLSDEERSLQMNSLKERVIKTYSKDIAFNVLTEILNSQ
ncbi:MAG TPA: glycosyltransferase [Chitinophagaceae bacterium]|jgi:glycosyltransferase involved in cell wall biosynthesis